MSSTHPAVPIGFWVGNQRKGQTHYSGHFRLSLMTGGQFRITKEILVNFFDEWYFNMKDVVRIGIGCTRVIITIKQDTEMTYVWLHGVFNKGEPVQGITNLISVSNLYILARKFQGLMFCVGNP